MADGTTRKKIACLGMPSYGEITTGAARGFYRASSGGLSVFEKQVRPEDVPLEWQIQNFNSSLLAFNMNYLWCWALNEAHSGRGCDYFAMQHADIEPESWWLDKAVAELEAKNLDVLGVVAPIKSMHGRTSTAMGRPDGSTWRIHGRLTMKEVYRLPETFTSEDIGYPLLINTGCWVCRFDESWAKKCHFTVNDRIVYVPSKKQYIPEVEPEDWFVSRLFHELGLKVGATRKVQLFHRGHVAFGNDKPWGSDEHDSEYLPASVLDRTEWSDWFPHDVSGWLTLTEGRELARLAEGKTVLEIGSYCGRSTICLAQKAIAVTAIDPFDGRGTPTPGDTYSTFTKNIERHGVGNKIRLLRGTTSEVVPTLPAVFDLVFIDGAHDYESVTADIEAARTVLGPGGLLAFHDYRLTPGEADGRWDPGVTQAVNELLAGGGHLLSRHDSLAVVRPPALTLTEVSNGV